MAADVQSGLNTPSRAEYPPNKTLYSKSTIAIGIVIGPKDAFQSEAHDKSLPSPLTLFSGLLDTYGLQFCLGFSLQ